MFASQYEPEPPQRRPGTAVPTGLIAVALALLSCGCRGRAQEEIYQQKLTGEIRVLEDQLYQADYQNRILMDRVRRAEAKANELDAATNRRPAVQKRSPPNASSRPSAAGPLAQPEPDPNTSGDPAAAQSPGDRTTRPRVPDPDDAGPLLDLDPDSLIDPGEPAKPDEIEMRPPADAKPAGRAPATDSAPSAKSPKPQPMQLALAPGGPQPPGADDMRVPPIEPGSAEPPPPGGVSLEGPPGQIELGSDLRFLGRAAASTVVAPPAKIEVHPSFSGRYRFDDEQVSEGMLLVVTALDADDKTVKLADFEIDAELTVVALDPTREPSEARIGIWEFTPDQVQELVRERPISGLHIPVRWQNDQPTSDDVLVHVRLRTDDEELRCEGTIKLNRAAGMAQWTPRAPSARR